MDIRRVTPLGISWQGGVGENSFSKNQCDDFPTDDLRRHTVKHPFPGSGFLNKDELQELRSGQWGEVNLRLLRRCLNVVKLFSGGIEREDLERIVAEAILEVMSSIKDPECSVATVNEELRRAIWRVKRRFHRDSMNTRRHFEANETEHRAQPQEDAEASESLYSWEKILESVSSLKFDPLGADFGTASLFLERAYSRLGRRDQQILAQYY